MGARDPNPKRPITVESVPSGEGDVTTSSVVVPAGGYKTFTVTTTPSSAQLNLWNFLWNIYIDADDPTYDYFGGSNLGTLLGSVIKIKVMDNLNWAQSSDRSNVRVHKIKITNEDASDHTAYLKYKAYTFVGVNG